MWCVDEVREGERECEMDEVREIEVLVGERGSRIGRFRARNAFILAIAIFNQSLLIIN